MTIGQRIKESRESANLSLAELGRRLDTTASAVQRWEKDGVSPTWDTLERIAGALRINVENLVSMDPVQAVRLTGKLTPPIEAMPFSERPTIPILAKCPAGVPESWVIEEDCLDDASHLVDLLAATPDRAFGLRISGESMAPIVMEDDIVVVDPRPTFEIGDMVVLRTEESHTLKFYVREQDNGFLLKAANPEHPDQWHRKMDVQWVRRVLSIYREHPERLRNTNHGPYSLVLATQITQVADIAVSAARMPEDFRESLKTALGGAHEVPEDDTERLLWYTGIVAELQEELRKLFRKKE